MKPSIQIIESRALKYISDRREETDSNGKPRLREYLFSNERLIYSLQTRVHWGECEVGSMMSNTGGSMSAADTYYQEAQTLLDELWRRLQETAHNKKLMKIICK